MPRSKRLTAFLTAGVFGLGMATMSPAMAGGFNWFGLKKSADSCDTVEECGPEGCAPGACNSGACASGGCESGTCETCGYEPKWHSEEWYAMRAHLPPGERRKIKHGRVMPVEPRPSCEEQPFWHKYQDSKNWPHPYVCVDRDSVKSIYATMQRRGWVDHATLHPNNFDPQTQMLNPSGIQRVNYVLTGLPPEFRTLYVSDANPELTQTRIANVKASLVGLAGNANALAVLARTADNPARPAIEVDRIHRARLDGMLPPTITYDQVSTEE